MTRRTEQMAAIGEEMIALVLTEEGLHGFTPGMSEEAVRERMNPEEEVHHVARQREGAHWDEPYRMEVERHPKGEKLARHAFATRVRVRLSMHEGSLSKVHVLAASHDKAVISKLATKVRAHFKKAMGAPEAMDKETGGADKRHRYLEGGESTVEVVQSHTKGDNATGESRVDWLGITWFARSADALGDALLEALVGPEPGLAGIWINTPQEEMEAKGFRPGPKARVRRFTEAGWEEVKSIEEGLHDTAWPLVSVSTQAKKHKCKSVELEVVGEDRDFVLRVGSKLVQHLETLPTDGVDVSHQSQARARIPRGYTSTSDMDDGPPYETYRISVTRA